ncbi:MAG: hypothetical protein QXK24_01170 [Ignisphaera sp.]
MGSTGTVERRASLREATKLLDIIAATLSSVHIDLPQLPEKILGIPSICQ